MIQSATADMLGRGPGFRYLRAKGNSIEGGTSEVMRISATDRLDGRGIEVPRQVRKPDGFGGWLAGLVHVLLQQGVSQDATLRLSG